MAPTCECGWSEGDSRINAKAHELYYHPRFEYGVPISSKLLGDDQIIVAPGCEYGPGARLAYSMARMAQREGGYLTTSFPFPSPEMPISPEWLEYRVMAYVATAESRAVAYASVAYVIEGAMCRPVGDGFETVHEFVTDPLPSISLIFTCKAWRRKGIAARLVHRIAADMGIQPAQVLWSPPLTQDGTALAKTFRTDGLVLIG